MALEAWRSAWRRIQRIALLLMTLAGPAACPIPVLADELQPLPMLLAERYDGKIDVRRSWISEKLDGVRAIWDGRILRFRSGNVVPAPQWFIDALPGQPLDGELWLGRGSFDRLSAIVRRQSPEDSEWRRVRYMIFELPNASGSFSDRIEQIRTVVAAANLPWLQAVAQFRVADESALRARLDEVVRGGGEGLMLHRDDASYETGRSSALLKLTPWQDAEAVVVGHLPGQGKYAGVVGTLRMEMADGRRFSLGSGLSDALRRDPPPIGTLVTYRYRELTGKGMPRFPRYLRVRDKL
jgi:DNA ligase-1